MKLPLAATLCTAVICGVLCGLGFWQLQRLEWKRGLLTEISRQQTAKPADLDSLPAGAPTPADLNYRKIRLTGRYLPLSPLHMPSRTYKGQVGWHVLSYFEQGNGKIWLVNRGWVPQEQLETLPAPTGDTVTVEAVARTPQTPGRFTPANNPARNLWYFYDPVAMFRAAGVAPAELAGFLARVQPAYVLEAVRTGTDELPVGGITILTLPNNHLSYALTWFSLALVFMGGYGAYVSRLNKV